MTCAVICKTTFNCTERTSVCYLSTYWLIGILNFESRISDIESRISNDPSGFSYHPDNEASDVIIPVEFPMHTCFLLVSTL